MPALTTSAATQNVVIDDRRLALPVKLFLLGIFLPIGFSIGPLQLNIVRLILMVMAVPLFFQLLSGRFGRMLPVDYFFIAHVAWMSIALSVNNPDQVVQQAGSVGLEFLGGYLLGRAYIRTRRQFMTFCQMAIWAIVLLLPLWIIETQTGRSLIIDMINRLPGVSSFAIMNTDVRLGLERVQGPFPHPISFGLFCSLMVPICFFAFRQSMSTGKRLLLATLVFLSAFLGLSAGVLMALTLQMGLIIWYLLLRNVTGRWLILTGLFVLIYIIVDLLSNRDPIRVFITYMTFSPESGYWRLTIFDWGWMNIFGSAENGIPPAPIFGIGLNDWIRPVWMVSPSVDNFWLLTTMRYGVPGFLFLVIGFFWAVWAVGRKNLEGDEELLDIRRAWVFVFVGMSVTLTTVHIWFTLYSFVFFFLGGGIWLLSAQPRSAKETNCDEAVQTAERATRYSRFPVRSVAYTTDKARAGRLPF